MKKQLIIWFVLMILLCGQGFSQKILVLEKTGKFKNFKYYKGSNITIGLEDTILHGFITSMNDSMVRINDRMSISLNEIKYISQPRYWVNYLSRAAGIFGLTYFSLTFFNRLINEQYPLLDRETFLITGALIGGAMLLNQFAFRKFRLEGKWQLKVIDLSLEVFP